MERKYESTDLAIVFLPKTNIYFAQPKQIIPKSMEGAMVFKVSKEVEKQIGYVYISINKYRVRQKCSYTVN